MVNNPLSRGLGNIIKVYLIACAQSSYAKFNKYEFCPVDHGEFSVLQYNLLKTFFEQIKNGNKIEEKSLNRIQKVYTQQLQRIPQSLQNLM